MIGKKMSANSGTKTSSPLCSVFMLGLMLIAPDTHASTEKTYQWSDGTLGCQINIRIFRHNERSDTDPENYATIHTDYSECDGRRPKVPIEEGTSQYQIKLTKQVTDVCEGVTATFEIQKKDEPAPFLTLETYDGSNYHPFSMHCRGRGEFLTVYSSKLPTDEAHTEEFDLIKR